MPRLPTPLRANSHTRACDLPPARAHPPEPARTARTRRRTTARGYEDRRPRRALAAHKTKPYHHERPHRYLPSRPRLSPSALAQLDSAPAVLWATCDTERLRELLAAAAVALVGNLSHTDYAKQAAFMFARDLAAAGVTILSGLNDGLEGTVHHGVLDAHGRSIAVLGCTPDTPPFPHRDEYLHRCILAQGAAVSEFPPGFHPPPRWCFIAAQRIIAALADIVVVIEAGERSSALFTAQLAADLGCEVAVVPGRITDPAARGTFGLLRDGAHPVSCAGEVLDLLRDAVVSHNRDTTGGSRTDTTRYAT